MIQSTALRQAQAAREQAFRLLVESIPNESILMLDVRGRIVSWNVGTERLHGYPEGEVVGQSVSRLFMPEDQASGRLRRLFALAERNGQFEEEGWSVRKDGSRFWASILLTAFKDGAGTATGFSIVTRDLTDRKREEEERSHLTRSTESARQEVAQANAVQEGFMELVSHELRTPLNAIVGWASLLEAGGLDPNIQAKAVETINRNAKLQVKLISNFVELSRLLSGKVRLDLHPVHLPFIIQSAVDSLCDAAQAKEIRIKLETSYSVDPVLGDASRLEQVVWELVSNAIKFSPRNAKVWVSLSKSRAGLELSVQDEGPGFRSSVLPHVFEPFQASDPNYSAHRGLGLAIVQMLLKLQGCSASAMNRENAPGALVKVVFPVDVLVLAPPVSRGANTSARRNPSPYPV
jgi:PAS domain S-box-containing protein